MKILYFFSIVSLLVYALFMHFKGENIASGIFCLVAILHSFNWNYQSTKERQGKQFFLFVDNKEHGSLYINRDAIDSIHREGMSVIVSTRTERITANSSYDETEEDTKKRIQKIVAQLNGEEEHGKE